MDTEKLLKDILSELLQFMAESEAEITVAADQNTYKINVSNLKNAAMLIGYHGETLRSLQHIFKAIAFRKMERNEISLILDVDNYKKEHEDNIIGLAEKKAEILRKTKEAQILPPMPPYMRRLVHLHFAQDKFSDIQTESIGESDDRQVVLKLKGET